MALGRRTKNVTAFFASVLVVAAGGWFLLAWWDHFQERNQDLVQARPFVYRNDVPFHVALLWEERVVTAPLAGKVSFPGGGTSLRVAKGDVLAVVAGPEGARRVAAPSPGYFTTLLDGQEGKWRYADLWFGERALADPGGRVTVAAGTMLAKGDPLGVFIPQPQELRAIGYVDRTPASEADMARGSVRIRRKEKDLPFPATVRVFRDLGARFKVYLTLPLFPLEFLDGRIGTFILSGEEFVGVVLPETAVVHRQGRQGVFVVQGQTVSFREVLGLPVSGRQFLVTEGLKAGEVVVARGARAKEGKVRLW
ncbi:hypothetical protein KAR29_04265 [Aminithiophilus ramosus]|uniref:HlyD family secretion protein n=2 Tax=Synergistales TaxID=649776 RepID=A0A9Q7A9S6_9BACT|nr:efflux RND transporter periplasmic adaptor subunit [Aminithiophilus ramosus]QTX33120.1 hypothetical protein KAR29_04265 [Aminithiophilus ramosus]QVL37118.1 hypothetical protein KIH16_04965 [Synergistota bacterium]